MQKLTYKTATITITSSGTAFTDVPNTPITRAKAQWRVPNSIRVLKSNNKKIRIYYRKKDVASRLINDVAFIV